MNKNMKYIAALGLGLGLLAAAPGTAFAQNAKTLPPITLDLRDAPLRQALEQLFQTAKVDFAIDNSVTGFVTLRITDQPFDNALKLILRASPFPLTYSYENGVYIVKPRVLDAPSIATAPPPILPEQAVAPATRWEVIRLTYIDAADLAQILGIQMLPFGARFGGQQGFGGMGGGIGGPGGFGTGMMGGLGGGFGAPGTGMGGFGSGVGGGFGAPGAGGGQPGMGFGGGQFGNRGGGNAGGLGGSGLGLGTGIRNIISNQAGDALLVEY
jgi:hypothetical protein